MSPVITHEIKWTKIPVTGFSFSFSGFWKVAIIRSVVVCRSPPPPLRLLLPASVCLSVSLEWLTCCCCCCGQEALKMNSKTVDAGKLKTELSRLLFALFRLMSFYFLLFFFPSQFVLAARFPTLTRWIVENAFCLSASLRRHVKHIWVACGANQRVVSSGLWPSELAINLIESPLTSFARWSVKLATGNSQLATVSPPWRPFMLIN